VNGKTREKNHKTLGGNSRARKCKNKAKHDLWRDQHEQGLLISYFNQQAVRALECYRASPQARSWRLSGLGRLPLCWCQCCQPATLLLLLLLFFLLLLLLLLFPWMLLLLPWLPLLLPPLQLLLLLPPPLLLLLPPPMKGVRACPAVCTVAAPLLQLMPAGRAPQGLEGTLLGDGCGRGKNEKLCRQLSRHIVSLPNWCLRLCV